MHRTNNPVKPRRFRVRWIDVAAMVATCALVATLIVWAFHLGAASAPDVAPPVPVPATVGEVSPGVSQGGTAHPVWAPDGMAPCPTEDSMSCYWDAATRGRPGGRSFVAQDGFIIYIDEVRAAER